MPEQLLGHFDFEKVSTSFSNSLQNTTIIQEYIYENNQSYSTTQFLQL